MLDSLLQEIRSSAQLVTGSVGWLLSGARWSPSSISSTMGLAPLATKCFLLVVCVTLAECSLRVRRWNACNSCNGGGGGGGRGGGGGGCGSGAQGSCCSSQDCPHEAPVCSEWGYCQCSSYQPGGPECGPGFGSGGGGGGGWGGRTGGGCGSGGC